MYDKYSEIFSNTLVSGKEAEELYDIGSLRIHDRIHFMTEMDIIRMVVEKNKMNRSKTNSESSLGCPFGAFDYQSDNTWHLRNIENLNINHLNLASKRIALLEGSGDFESIDIRDGQIQPDMIDMFRCDNDPSWKAFTQICDDCFMVGTTSAVVNLKIDCSQLLVTELDELLCEVGKLMTNKFSKDLDLIKSMGVVVVARQSHTTKVIVLSSKNSIGSENPLDRGVRH
jgi:hypothetical protein